jgi:hypothetical protein
VPARVIWSPPASHQCSLPLNRLHILVVARRVRRRSRLASRLPNPRANPQVNRQLNPQCNPLINQQRSQLQTRRCGQRRILRINPPVDRRCSPRLNPALSRQADPVRTASPGSTSTRYRTRASIAPMVSTIQRQIRTLLRERRLA